MFYSLDRIARECLEVRVSDEELVLLHIEWSSSRGFGGAYERYICSLEKAQLLKSLIVGKMCYFGEIAGKHSEVYGDIEESEVCIDTQTEKVIEFLELHPSGHDYNHSFLCTLTDRYSDQGYEKGDEGYDENLVMLCELFYGEK